MITLYLFFGCNPPELPDPFNQGQGQVYDAGTPVNTETQPPTEDTGEDDSGSEEDPEEAETGED